MLFDSENILENKLIILYALNHFKTPLTKEQITQIILENIQISYFDIQFLIENLKDDDFVLELFDNKIPYYTISEKGKSTLDLFKNRIPAYLKEIINMYIAENKDKVLKQVKNYSSYKKLGDEDFIVNLKLFENEIILIDLNLNVASKKQAMFICNNWDNNGDKLYTEIINTLID